MAFISTLQLRRRASRRIIRDMPRDLEEMGLDDPLALLTGRVREVIAHEQQFERGKAPFDRRARFGVPASLSSSRLRSSDGLESFHFAINKTRARSASAFDRYATRDAALDDLARPEHGLDEGQAQPQRPAPAFDDYAMSHGGEAHEAPLSLTTLDSRPDIRREQWDQVEAHERAQRRNPGGGPPRINLRFEQAPDLLIEAAHRNECPSGLRDTILAERDRVAAGRDLPTRLRRDGVPWISSDAPHVMTWLETLPGWKAPKDGQLAAAKLSLGRGTPTVIAGELELPRGLDDAGHRTIMKGLNRFIQSQAEGRSLSEDAGREPATIPVMVVRHRPDVLNNPLNAHLHFQHGTRLASADASGQLHFADHKVEAIASRGWIKRLRCEAARLMNLELDRTDADYRLSPDTYAAMGVDAATQTKLHGEKVVLERAGVPTDTGMSNDAEGWRRKFEQIRRDHDVAVLKLDHRHRGTSARIRTLDDEEAKRLEAERVAARSEEERALRLRLEAAEIAILIDMARSRPEQTARYAGGYADKAARPDGHDSYASMRWRQRGVEAEAHLVALDVELAVEREAMSERKRDASLAEQRARERWEGIEEAIVRQTASSDRELALATSQRPTPAAAVTLVATRALYLTTVDGGFVVHAADDPAKLVQGVDLSSQTGRLRGIHAAQQKELAQLRAYVRRHGQQALEEDALGSTSPWMQQAARKWRDSAVLARMTLADRGLAKAHAVIAAQGDDTAPRQVPLSELSVTLPLMPGRADPALLARNGVVFAPVGRPHLPEARVELVPALSAAVGLKDAPATRPPTTSGAKPRTLPTRVAIPDGFGGLRDGPAPRFIGETVGPRVIAFDRTTKAPTKPLLRLLAFAGRNPDKLVFASDDRLMTLPGTPALIEPLMRMWRHDDVVQALVVQTVVASRAAGRPVWPSHLASSIRELDPAPDRPFPRDWSSGITR